MYCIFVNCINSLHMQICYTFARQSAHLQTELVKSDDKKMFYLLYFYTAHSCCGSEINVQIYICIMFSIL